MRRKLLYIFTLTLLATVCVQSISHAQEEGEELPIRPIEASSAEKDSIQDEVSNAGESKGDFLNPIVITPKDTRLLTPDVDPTVNTNNTTGSKPSDESADKVKESDTPSNLKFNFIYYLFYKFKVGSSTSGSD